MHDTDIELEDGRTYKGIIVGGGYDNDVFGKSYIEIFNYSDRTSYRFLVNEIKNAITRNERVSISQPNADYDEIKSMKDFWDWCEENGKKAADYPGRRSRIKKS